MNELLTSILERISFIRIDLFRTQLENYIKNILDLPYEINGILLYGSVARGESVVNDNHVSDIDLIIISKDLPEDLWEKNEKIFNLTYEFSANIQAAWWTPEEMRKSVENKYYLVLDALDEGKILHDPNGFLEKMKQELKEDLNKKNVIKKDLYWRWPSNGIGKEIEF